MLVLTDKQAEELDALINELPTKYGVLLFRLFTKFAQERAEDAGSKKLSVKEEAPKTPVEIEAE